MSIDACSTFSGDLLLIMVSSNYSQTKVVRYCDYIEKQNIQFDDKGHPVYLSSGMNNIKYICENRKSKYICSGLKRACTSCSQPFWKTSVYIQRWLSSETIETIKTIYSL